MYSSYAVMLEVYCIATVLCRKRTYACKLLCVELHTIRKTPFANNLGVSFQSSAFSFALCLYQIYILPTWRRSFMLGSITSLRHMYCSWKKSSQGNCAPPSLRVILPPCTIIGRGRRCGCNWVNNRGTRWPRVPRLGGRH